MDWSTRMNWAIDYIEEHLDSELSLEEVAKQACCSKYHFHRVFLASFNITCAEYIRRRKLTLAATELLTSKTSIADIALKYGYHSPNAFTRAFRDVHGITPSKARSTSVRLSSFNRVFSPSQNRGGKRMDYTIIEVPEFSVIGKGKHFDLGSFIESGPKFWKDYVNSEDYQALYSLNEGRPGEITQSPLLSAYFPKENGQRDEFVDVLGIESQEISPSTNFDVHKVLAATYAEFMCTYKTSMKTNRYIYGEWFSSTGYERDGSKPDIVSYFPIPFKPMGEMRVRWWIPVVGQSD
ncbi:hypothetical protein CS022_14035 [Veronia nyctiphanis]|uniref:HTH araC/xylS-type domain-containing protein n=1 Tax=Veronia nyctiphanis TaxID=1278244 RepID=A0A4Q0YP20_9GAMM|nr:AraC family transcriptional regulator [Veronia nyctiphanis]RXJ72750.1 hypothetical protein CS022_14035 [Veronia nyctiphanis]